MGSAGRGLPAGLRGRFAQARRRDAALEVLRDVEVCGPTGDLLGQTAVCKELPGTATLMSFLPKANCVACAKPDRKLGGALLEAPTALDFLVMIAAALPVAHDLDEVPCKRVFSHGLK